MPYECGPVLHRMANLICNDDGAHVTTDFSHSIQTCNGLLNKDVVRFQFLDSHDGFLDCPLLVQIGNDFDFVADRIANRVDALYILVVAFARGADVDLKCSVARFAQTTGFLGHLL